MQKPVRALLCALGLWVFGSVGLAAASSPPPLAPQIPFESYRLPNGLQVILSEDHRLPLVAVNLWYHVGPANEKPGRTGFAHLFEHMMFQGSKNVPEGGEHIKILEGAGATDFNGTTDFDRTNYFETVPSNQLELALWLESDRMGFLLETLDQKKLTNQQDVVRNERRQSIENRPYGLVDEAVYHTVFPQGHPYYPAVMGSHADIEAARLGDVRDFFRQYYAPNNASIAIVGDFDKAQVRALIEKYFGPIPAGPEVPRIDVKTPPITAERHVTVTDKVELPRITLAWLTPAIYQPGDADADLLAQILGGGKASRLYRKLVHDQQIAQDVGVEQESMMLGSVFSIEVTARPGVSLEKLRAAVDAELALMRREGPTAQEVERARNGAIASIIHSIETLGGLANRANQYNHYLGDPGYLPKDIARYVAVDAQSIRSFAETTLVDSARVIVEGVPGDKVVDDVPRVTEHAPVAAVPSTPKDWRATQPPPGPAGKLALPVPQRFTLANGLTVLLVEQHRLPVIAANLVVLAGSDRNPKDRPGLAAFAADMLQEGTRTRSSQKLAEDVALLGASLASSSTTDYSGISLHALTNTADEAFGLMADVALNPAFARAEIERVRASRQTALVQQRDNPTSLAQRVLNRAVYGSAHPYGYTELGTQAALKSINREQLVAFWKAGYQPQDAALIVSGDITAAQLRALAEKYFGAWSGKAAPAPRIAARQAEAGKILVVDKPGAPQTALRLGEVAAARSSPDYVPLEVLNNTLGGLFTSRINLNLREKNGYTYGARTGFGFRRGPGPFIVATSVRTDVTAPALKEIFNELGRIRAERVSDNELVLSKDSFSRSLPGLFETSAEAAGSVGQLFVYGLPLDYFNTLPASIQAVSGDDVLRVARKYVVPEKMVVVAVGDRAKIEAPLRALGIAPTQARAAD